MLIPASSFFCELRCRVYWNCIARMNHKPPAHLRKNSPQVCPGLQLIGEIRWFLESVRWTRLPGFNQHVNAFYTRLPQRVRQRITFLFIYLHFWVVLRFYSHFWVMSRSMLFPPCKQPAPACTSFQHPPLKRNFFENSVFSVPSVFASQTNLQSCPHRASWHIFPLLLQPLDLSYHHLLILNFF